ncbi:alpha/beta hydrolase [Candidatus Parcubacteria bacterium]|nr:MAG: alpha/beta hydrolase [Candidatus Parcubacteria bacterium]
MEQEIKIKTKDNHIIYGTRNWQGKHKRTLLIFVHGLTGSSREHQYFNAVPFFTKKGFDTFRFDFYSRKPNGRQLSDTCVTIHVNDLKLVLNKFQDKYKNIFLIGHSLGALVILKSNLSGIKKIVLWDPTKGFTNTKDKFITYNKSLNKYILRWGKETLANKKMINEWAEAREPGKIIRKLDTPIKFIFAESGTHKHWLPYLKMIKPKNDYVIIRGSSHNFCEEGTEEKLFEETLKWIV